MSSFLLTIDVEDWFQVENLRPWIPFSTWDSRELAWKPMSTNSSASSMVSNRTLEAGTRKFEAQSSKEVIALRHPLDSTCSIDPTDSIDSIDHFFP